MENNRTRWVPIAGALAALLCLLLCGYVGAYFAVVQPITTTSHFARSYPHRSMSVTEASYPQEWMERLFAPIHQLDRKWFRPTVWNP